MLEDRAALRYKGEAGTKYHYDKRAIPEAAIKWVASSRAKKFAEHVSPESVVLEYGVGFGWNLAALDCKRKIGFDVSDFLETSVRNLGIEFIKDTKSVSDASVDVVICHHTLEHVLNPPDVLREIWRMLRPDGKLLLAVPCERGKKYTHYHREEPNHHLYSWNVQTAGNLVEELGFECDEAKLKLYGYDRFAAVWSERFHLGEFGFQFLQTAVRFLKPIYEVQIVASKKQLKPEQL